jgi:arsenate reductase
MHPHQGCPGESGTRFGRSGPDQKQGGGTHGQYDEKKEDVPVSASNALAAKAKTTILFLCTGNSCRSQMAEGWARYLRSDVVDPYSAGIEKHGLNAYAVRVMAEVGVDISGQKSKLVEELPVATFDYVITLCGHAHETCPYFPGRTIHHGFPDPPELAKNAASEEETLQAYRMVRDQIKQFIDSLPESLPR